MVDHVASHYSENLELADVIAQSLRNAGKDLNKLTTTDLAMVDEYIYWPKATLELAAKINLNADSRVLDIGNGLRRASANASRNIRLRGDWHRFDSSILRCSNCNVRLGRAGRTYVIQARGRHDLPFDSKTFDAAMTIHVAMNIAAKDMMYLEARRVVKPGGAFAVYDVLQGEGGEVLYPVPWARDPSISHLATPDQMKSLLGGAGFKLLDVQELDRREPELF